MAVYDYFDNMHDTRLKPRLLKSLTKDRLPDEKHTFPSPSEFSAVVSSIKIHGLLSESFRGEPVEPKLVETWKTAVDAWIDRVLLLVSSKMPDKCWAGICLLGVTCQECSSNRFLASHSVWFQKLTSQIQLSSDSHFIKVAACASLSDLFTRLGGFPNAKKDGISQAGKLIQPILKLLAEDVSEAVQEGAVDLLCTLINFFPSSVHRHYDSVAAVIISKILSGKFNESMSTKFAKVLALLPRARSDEDSWSLLMQKILISINTDLNDSFQGLEEGTKSSEAVRLLVPPGKDPLPPLGGQSMSGEAFAQTTKWFEHRLTSRVSSLMQCCGMMLISPYPVQVTVPVRSLLALVGRVLSVDGSLGQSLLPLTPMQQEFICSDLPVLHSCSLDLLTAVIKGVRSQLLPYAADMVRLLTEYFRRCALPSLRIKVYSIMRVLLISMGVGIAMYLAQEVITNAFADLNFVSHGNVLASSNPYSSSVMSGALQQTGHRKRKHVSRSPGEQPDEVHDEVDILKNQQITPLSLQIAAVEALEALLTVGGALKSECWRLDVDHLLITVASNACSGGLSNVRCFIISEESTQTQADFQLAALRALLASLLSPTRVRPPYLSQGLELFRRGKQETGTKLAEFCAHALLALEVLIHPRALPLSDFPSGNRSIVEGGNHRFPEQTFFTSQKSNTQFSRGMLGVDDFEPEDDLYDTWLENLEGGGTHFNGLPDKQTENTNEPLPMNEMAPVVDVPSAANLSSGASAGDRLSADETVRPSGSIDVKNVQSTDGNMESVQLKVPAYDDDVGPPVSDQRSSGEGVLSFPTVLAANEMPSEDLASVSDFRKWSSDARGVSRSISDSGKGKGLRSTSTSDSDSVSLDSLPDIVVGDPDSD